MSAKHIPNVVFPVTRSSFWLFFSLYCGCGSGSGWLRARKRPFSVTRVALEGMSSVCIELRPVDKRPFRYVPGQFVIVSFQSKHISPQAAPIHAFVVHADPAGIPAVDRADQWRLDPACRPDYRGGAGLYSRPVRSVQPCVYRSGSRDHHDRRRYRHHAHVEDDSFHGLLVRSSAP